MRFRPRHYVLIVIILALGVYNLVRLHRAHEQTRLYEQSVTSSGPIPATLGPAPQSPAWQSFDKAAALRNEPDQQFQPALHELEQQITTAPAAEKGDLDGCHTWLLFYREGAVHAAANDPWRQRSTQHLDACVRQHRDVSG